MFNQQVTFLYTADLAGSTAFYGQILGLPLVLDQSLDQGAVKYFRSAGMVLSGSVNAPRGNPSPPTASS